MTESDLSGTLKSMFSENVYAASARMRKATRMAQAFVHVGTIDVDDEVFWADVEHLANVKRASEETRQLAVKIYYNDIGS